MGDRRVANVSKPELEAVKGVYHLSGGEILVWQDGGAICIKTVSKSGDPIDMGEDEALELAELLQWLVANPAPEK
jgi:hypothetical protein